MKKETRLLFFTPLTFLPVFLTSLLCFLLIPLFQEPPWWAPQVLYAISIWATTILLYYVVKQNGFLLKEFCFKGKFTLFDLFLGIVFTFLAIGIWVLTEKVLTVFHIQSWSVHYPYRNLIIEVPVIFIFAVISAPLEEILFRGFLISTLNFKMHSVLAAVVSIIVFSIYHYIPFGPGAAIHIFFWSIFPTILFLWRKNFYAACIMHMLNNLFAYILMDLVFNL
jgi:membrane protease YdiL (CAAX protease family)